MSINELFTRLLVDPRVGLIGSAVGTKGDIAPGCAVTVRLTNTEVATSYDLQVFVVGRHIPGYQGFPIMRRRYINVEPTREAVMRYIAETSTAHQQETLYAALNRKAATTVR